MRASHFSLLGFFLQGFAEFLENFQEAKNVQKFAEFLGKFTGAQDAYFSGTSTRFACLLAASATSAVLRNATRGFPGFRSLLSGNVI